MYFFPPVLFNEWKGEQPEITFSECPILYIIIGIFCLYLLMVIIWPVFEKTANENNNKP
jgi:hypothetical protein